MTHHRAVWRAGEDGEAHAIVGRRALCGAPAVAPRWAWPETSRCPRCIAAIGRHEAGRYGGPAAVIVDRGTNA